MIIFDIFGIRDVGRVRDVNEDYYTVVEPEDETMVQERGRLFVVADGMGGNGSGEVASKLAVDTVTDAYYSGGGGEDIGDSIRNAVRLAHDAIWKEAGQNPEHYKMGVTITAMVVRGDEVAIAHVGDTRAYVVRRGKIEQLTQDHNWAGEQLKKGAITKVHAETHPRRKVLTRALGQTPEVEIDLYKDVVEPNDIFFLCTDGLYDTMSDTEIQRALLETNPEMAARELVARANRNGGADNISAIVIKTVYEGRPFLGKESKRLNLDFKFPWKLEMPEFKFPLPVIIGLAAIALAIIIGGLGLFFRGPKKPLASPNKPNVITVNPGANPDLRKSPAKVKITTAPSGAIITVDGMSYGPSPIEISLAPGSHTIEIVKDGFQVKKVPLTVKEGEQQIPLNFLLVPHPSERSPDMVFIPAGFFTMGREGGSKEEGPSHRIYLDAFYIDRYEISNEEYRKFVEATMHKAPPYWKNPEYNAPKLPVVGVVWADADAFCRWANKRLPTEAEWEKAARGADGLLYPWGNAFEAKKANIAGDADDFPGLAPVDALPDGKSPYGVFNVIGNAAEWTADYFDPAYYRSMPAKNPRGPTAGERRVIRGGSFKTSMNLATTTYRHAFAADSVKEFIGFRCAKD